MTRKLIQIIERSLVGFALVIAAEFEDGELRAELCGNARKCSEIITECHTGQHLETIFLRQIACRMSVIGMCRFVREHTGKRGFVVNKLEQSRIDINATGRNRKGIDRIRIVDDGYGVVKVLILYVR